MKRTSFLVSLLLLATYSYSQDLQMAPPALQKLRNGGYFQRENNINWRENNKYALMDNSWQNNKQPRGTFHYEESLYKIHGQPLPAAPQIKTYRFGKDKHGVPVEKKN